MKTDFIKHLESIKFFLLSENLTKDLFQAIDRARNAELVNIEDEEQVVVPNDELEQFLSKIGGQEEEFPAEIEQKNLQRFISQQLYFHLGFLSSNEFAKNGDAFDIRNIVRPEMSRILGLPENALPLNQLADEFINWLHESGEVTTGWGQIIYCDGDKMYLIEIPIAVDDVKPNKRFFRNPLSSRKKEKVLVAR